jgi:hypothetical protein
MLYIYEARTGLKHLELPFCFIINQTDEEHTREKYHEMSILRSS